MGRQIEQKANFDKSINFEESIQPVTIMKKEEILSIEKYNQPKQASSFQDIKNGPQISAHNIQDKNSLNKLEKIEEVNNEINLIQDRLFPDYYLDHKNFLENYKRERQKQTLKGKSKLPLTQEVYQEEQQSSDMPYKLSNQMINQHLGKIHKKLRKSLIIQNQRSSIKNDKIFTQSGDNKNDVQHIARQKRFIRSQQSKNCNYQESTMPCLKKSIQIKAKTQSIQPNIDLQNKAKRLVHRLQHQQENLLGRLILRKKKEESKRLYEEAQNLRRKEQFQNIKRQQRKLKAEQNLLLMKEKSKLGQIVHRTSLEQLRKQMDEKQAKLQLIRATIRQSQQEKQYGSFKKAPVIIHRAKHHKDKLKGFPKSIQRGQNYELKKEKDSQEEVYQTQMKINSWLKKRWKLTKPKQQVTSSHYQSQYTVKKSLAPYQRQDSRNHVMKINDSASLPRKYKYKNCQHQQEFSVNLKQKRMQTQYLDVQRSFRQNGSRKKLTVESLISQK